LLAAAIHESHEDPGQESPDEQAKDWPGHVQERIEFPQLVDTVSAHPPAVPRHLEEIGDRAAQDNRNGERGHNSECPQHPARNWSIIEDHPEIVPRRDVGTKEALPLVVGSFELFGPDRVAE
jgi:hypothetical protein